MKKFVAFYILAFMAAAQTASLTPEQSAQLREIYEACIKSSHVDKALVTKARGGDFAEDEHLDDFFTCMFKRVGFLDDEGHLKGDVIKSKTPTDISNEDIDKVLAACEKVQKEPKSKVAKAAYKCYLTETPVKIQLIAD